MVFAPISGISGCVRDRARSLREVWMALDAPNVLRAKCDRVKLEPP